MARLPARHARRPRAVTRLGRLTVRDELRRRFFHALGRPGRPRRARLRRGGDRGAAACGAGAGARAGAGGDRGRAPRLGVGARSCTRRRIWLLEAVRERGLKVGIVSNTSDPPDLWLTTLRPTASPSTSTRSCSRRSWACESPRREIYRAVLDALGVQPADALFVGDRVREDVQGPAALGMRTCLVTYFRVDTGDHSLADSSGDEPGRGARRPSTGSWPRRRRVNSEHGSHPPTASGGRSHRAG